MKYIYAITPFLLVINLLSCDPSADFENNRRTFVTGNVIDASGDPLPNLTVESFGQQLSLGITKTDIDGNFNMTSLDSDAETFDVGFNSDQNSNPELSSILYQFNNRGDGEFILTDVVLKPLATLNFNIEKTNPDTEEILWDLSYENANCQLLFGNDMGADVTDCTDTGEDSNFLTIEDPNFDRDYSTVLNSEATFTYTIDGGEQQTVQIPISENQTTYVFEY